CLMSCWSEWTHSARQRTCVHSLAAQHRDQCQDTASRFVGAVPTYRLDWVVMRYSWCRPLAPPMDADGQSGASFSYPVNGGPLHCSSTSAPFERPSALAPKHLGRGVCGMAENPLAFAFSKTHTICDAFDEAWASCKVLAATSRKHPSRSRRKRSWPSAS